MELVHKTQSPNLHRSRRIAVTAMLGLVLLALITACSGTSAEPVALTVEEEAAAEIQPAPEIEPLDSAKVTENQPAAPDAEAPSPTVMEAQGDSQADIVEETESVAESEMAQTQEQAGAAAEEEDQTGETGAPPAAQVDPPSEAETEAEVATATPRPLDQFLPTDPATVSLASGEVQLVEFFAFW